MANLTDKMKDFNAIFKNDELAKGWSCFDAHSFAFLIATLSTEISQLIEKANSTKKPKNEIRYSRVIDCLYYFLFSFYALSNHYISG